MEVFKGVFLFIGSIVAITLFVYLAIKSLKGLLGIRIRRIDYNSTPVLMSALTGDLMNGATGTTTAGYSYMFIVSGESLFSKEKNTGIYSVELPFESGVHLVGIPKQINERRFNLGLKVSPEYEPVMLEGDYPEYFDLYAQNGQQTKTRYVLDPKGMVFTIDFCNQYYWEIHGDTLYVISIQDHPSFDLIDQFIREIQPAVELPSKRKGNAMRLPYTHTTGRTMHCPHCKAQLEVAESYMQCPNGDGYLIAGNQIIEERAQRNSASITEIAATEEASQKAPDNVKSINCAYCTAVMEPSFYQNTNIVIDVCTRCPYRWVDGHEIIAVIGKAV